MILTSNFQIAGHLPQAVAISQGIPRGWTGRVYRPLAPPWSMIKISDPVKYIQAYRQQILAKLDPQQVLIDLGGDDFIMLCWEKPGDFCHRLLVAAWLRKELGVRVDELNPKLKQHADWLRRMRK